MHPVIDVLILRGVGATTSLLEILKLKSLLQLIFYFQLLVYFNFYKGFRFAFIRFWSPDDRVSQPLNGQAFIYLGDNLRSLSNVSESSVGVPNCDRMIERELALIIPTN